MCSRSRSGTSAEASTELSTSDTLRSCRNPRLEKPLCYRFVQQPCHLDCRHRGFYFHGSSIAGSDPRSQARRSGGVHRAPHQPRQDAELGPWPSSNRVAGFWNPAVRPSGFARRACVAPFRGVTTTIRLVGDDVVSGSEAARVRVATPGRTWLRLRVRGRCRGLR